MWGAQWPRQHILFRCDNEAEVHILNSRTSKVPALMHLLRDLVLPATRFSFSFSAKHVPGVHNEIADALSFSLAGVLAPSTSSKPSAHATPAPGSVNLSTLQERCVSFLLHRLATSTYKFCPIRENVTSSVSKLVRFRQMVLRALRMNGLCAFQPPSWLILYGRLPSRSTCQLFIRST